MPGMMSSSEPPLASDAAITRGERRPGFTRIAVERHLAGVLRVVEVGERRRHVLDERRVHADGHDAVVRRRPSCRPDP